ncbi:ribonuclease H-like domain-containing protein [Methanoculleus sediminis]|uniref:ribonuclease H-like domain-containing protein n=1 Tax=Methanoculleus sediminis TaxID=1550566 RepID=UPI00069BB358|nr:ribonuclease H-like domain-containing protein [Methanoculleus sediminis]
MVRAFNRAGRYAPGIRSPFVARPDDEEARRLRDDLVAGYRGRALEDVFCGRETLCPSGTCYVIESESPMSLDARDPGRAAAALLGDLTLVRGIGEATRRRLGERGCRSVADLMGHPLYRRDAARLLDSITGGDTRDILGLIERRRRRSDPLLLDASRFHAPEEFVFLDIETLGLFSRPIILIGLARVSGGSIAVRQYLSRSVEEEEAALASILPDLEAEGTALVTFNGRAFDVPYLRDRFACHGIPADLAVPHFDVLHFARRRWRDSLPSCRLGALETGVLGLARADDVPSRMVPEFYETYRRTGSPGPLVPVVEHNRQDIVSLARLFALLRGDGGGAAPGRDRPGRGSRTEHIETDQEDAEKILPSYRAHPE